jgi:hypothetical protein
MRQITAHLDEQAHVEIIAYARNFGLDGSGIANLLLVRELRIARLTSAVRKLTPSASGTRRTKITAHQPDGSVFAAFRDHAKACGMTVSSALASLVRAELEEQWLDKALAKVDSN